MIVHFILIIRTGRDPRKSLNLNNKLYITNNNNNLEASIKTDCGKTIRYCTNDFDCGYMCNASVSFNVKNVCNTITRLCTPTPLGPTLECDAKKGFLDTYVQTELDSFWKCLNTKPYFFDEQQKLYEYVCSGGEVNYNFDTNIQLTCKCALNQVRVYNINKPNIPVCVEKNKLKILSSFIEA